MNARLLLAGVAAGIVIFTWGAISHMVLPLGEVGIQPLSEEAAITAVFQDKIKSPGLYLYPYSQDSTAMEQLLKERPRGILTYTPAEEPFSMAASLGIQCLNDILVGIVLAWLLARAAPAVPSLGSRITLAVGMMVLATAGYLVPLWNWYGFSAPFVAAGGVEAIIGAILGTLVISRIALTPGRA